MKYRVTLPDKWQELTQSDIKDAIEIQKKKAEENDIRLLQERINKAVEYIENNSYIAPIEEIPLFTMNSNPQDLLNILQGSDKE